MYALNVMLVPVNLSGVGKSLKQAWSGQKTPFGRTPKTRGRTWIPPLYIAAQFALLGFCLLTSTLSLAQDRTGHGIWAMGNAIVFLHVVVNLLWDEAPESGTAPPGKP